MLAAVALEVGLLVLARTSHGASKSQATKKHEEEWAAHGWRMYIAPVLAADPPNPFSGWTISLKSW
jgi:hypothetical protein